MEPLIRPHADELSALVMENELLRYEVAHLRARSLAAEHRLTQLTERLERRAAATDEDAAEELESEPTLADSSARDDLVWLLDRLDGSPVRHVLRRRPRYRELVQRYLPGAEA